VRLTRFIRKDVGTASLLVGDVAQASAALLVVPGGRCRADRYQWLGSLAAAGVRPYILDGLISTPSVDAHPSDAIGQVAAALAQIGQSGLPVHAVGHSAGAAALLDMLDPPSNPAAQLAADFRPAHYPASITIVGCSLQPRTLGMHLPHRREHGPLERPAWLPLLFLAGVQDAIAPPDLVERTVARFVPPAALIAMQEATHYGWAGPREVGDNPAFDTDMAMDTAGQRHRTLAYLIQMIRGDEPAPIDQDRRRL
jgi:hypothetical protein